MNYTKFLLTALVLVSVGLMLPAEELNAQNKGELGYVQSLKNKVSNFLGYGKNDDDPTQKATKKVYKSPSNQSVTVSVKSLDQADRVRIMSSKIWKSFRGEEKLKVADIDFSPNFEEGTFFLTFTAEEEEDTQITILDVAGREVHSETIEDFTGTYESEINISSDAKGTYFLKISQGFSLMNKKLVIE